MVDLKVPTLGESITEAVVGKWLKNVGDHVDADEPVVDLETDKITMQIPSPKAGALSEQRFAEGETVRVGDVVGLVDEQAAGRSSATSESAPAPVPAAVPAAASRPERELQAMPRLTATASPLAPVPERGPDGRKLSPSERKEFREGAWSHKGASPVQAPPAAAAPAPVPSAQEVVEPMSPLRKRIAERLVQAQRESASLTTFNEVDMSHVMALRSRFQEEFVERHGIKLGFMSFFAKAAVAALKMYPGLNAEVRDDAIVYKKHYDIGIAVGTPKGLVVPVLRAVDRIGFAGVEQGIVDLATRARGAKLTLDDLVGATFTITNGGIYGSMMSTPLLNYPQTGILGMHNIVKRPMVVGDSVEIRPMMYIALTYDHRVVDGREAVQFLVAVKERIEDPERLMFAL